MLQMQRLLLLDGARCSLDSAQQETLSRIPLLLSLPALHWILRLTNP